MTTRPAPPRGDGVASNPGSARGAAQPASSSTLLRAVYVCVLFWLLMAGPGKASLDQLLARRFANPA